MIVQSFVVYLQSDEKLEKEKECKRCGKSNTFQAYAVGRNGDVMFIKRFCKNLCEPQPWWFKNSDVVWDAKPLKYIKRIALWTKWVNIKKCPIPLPKEFESVSIKNITDNEEARRNLIRSSMTTMINSTTRQKVVVYDKTMKWITLSHGKGLVDVLDKTSRGIVVFKEYMKTRLTYSYDLLLCDVTENEIMEIKTEVINDRVINSY